MASLRCGHGRVASGGATRRRLLIVLGAASCFLVLLVGCGSDGDEVRSGQEPSRSQVDDPPEVELEPGQDLTGVQLDASVLVVGDSIWRGGGLVVGEEGSVSSLEFEVFDGTGRAVETVQIPDVPDGQYLFSAGHVQAFDRELVVGNVCPLPVEEGTSFCVDPEPQVWTLDADGALDVDETLTSLLSEKARGSLVEARGGTDESLVVTVEPLDDPGRVLVVGEGSPQSSVELAPTDNIHGTCVIGEELWVARPSSEDGMAVSEVEVVRASLDGSELPALEDWRSGPRISVGDVQVGADSGRLLCASSFAVWAPGVQTKAVAAVLGAGSGDEVVDLATLPGAGDAMVHGVCATESSVVLSGASADRQTTLYWVIGGPGQLPEPLTTELDVALSLPPQGCAIGESVIDASDPVDGTAAIQSR